jgi:hypothetical protein
MINWQLAGQVLFSVTIFLAVANDSMRAEERPPQEMISVDVRVVDDSGTPVAGVELNPWALRSGQGHGNWPEKIEVKPQQVTTDEKGEAQVAYPRYAIPPEFVQTTEVTLSVDHPDYVYQSHNAVNVPVEEAHFHIIELKRGGILEVEPIENNKPAAVDNLHAIWSDSRWYQSKGFSLTSVEGKLRLPTMAAGKGQVMLVRVDGEHATHFSPIIEVDLVAGETTSIKAKLLPAVRIEGVLGPEVPRPVKEGRAVVRSLAADRSWDHVTWGTWTKIENDGRFVIDRWPGTEPIQITALTDRYIGQSGKAPPEVVDPPRNPDFFRRPQVFHPDKFDQPLVVAMEPLGECKIHVADEDGNPLPDITVSSNPNVGWWNDGSQIYCDSLYSFEKFLIDRDSSFGRNTSQPRAFSTKSDASGTATLFLPTRKESLYAGSEDYVLPIDRGRRTTNIEAVPEETTQISLVLEKTGQEFLGDWDKLAGVLFGCTGEECRRLLEDPGFRKRITAVRVKFDEAENIKDPNLLKNAFAEISAAFDEVGDQEEVVRWRQKAEAQASKLEGE